jgi:hypothetical protein
LAKIINRVEKESNEHKKAHFFNGRAKSGFTIPTFIAIIQPLPTVGRVNFPKLKIRSGL